MEFNKIKKILSEYGTTISSGTWMKFPSEITIIYLNQDANLYIGSNQIFQFDSSTNSLNISEDDSYEKEFLPDEDYPVHRKVQLSDIGGFIASSQQGPYGAYFRKKI